MLRDHLRLKRWKMLDFNHVIWRHSRWRPFLIFWMFWATFMPNSCVQTCKTWFLVYFNTSNSFLWLVFGYFVKICQHSIFLILVIFVKIRKSWFFHIFFNKLTVFTVRYFTPNVEHQEVLKKWYLAMPYIVTIAVFVSL